MKIEFTDNERTVLEELFSEFTRAVLLFARLHGVPASKLAVVQLAPDRKSIEVPD